MMSTNRYFRGFGRIFIVFVFHGAFQIALRLVVVVVVVALATNNEKGTKNFQVSKHQV